MSAPIRPQHRPPPIHHDRATADERHFAPNRIAAKLGSVDGSSSKSTHHTSRLAKRTSRIEQPLQDATTRLDSDVKSPSIPMRAAHRNTNVPREDVVSPHSASAAQHQSRPSRFTSTQPPPNTRTPSLFSGSSAPTLSSPRSHGLRRKPSTIDSYKAQARAHAPRIEADRATMHSRAEGYNEALDDAVLGIVLPPTGKYEYRNEYLSSAAPASKLPHLDTQNTYSMRDTTPPVPGLSHSGTPSSRYTDSPYSHVPTPSSASSYSGGLVTSAVSDAKYKTNSPLRPRPISSIAGATTNETTRSALPPVRESSTSSSNSTVKAQQAKSAKAVSDAPPTATLSTSSNSATSTKSHRRSSAYTDVKVPPELAHLNVDAPSRTASTSFQPRRPSRDRTPSLTHLNDPSPVVHSDLPKLYTTYHKRTPSQDTNGSANSTSLRSRFGFSPRSSSKQASPRVDSAFSPSPSTKRSLRRTTPDSALSEHPRVLRKDSPAVNQPPSPAPPSKSPRFSFLSRKSKSTLEKPAEKPKREARKGPVAGTGHEKYARFGFRGRTGSTANSQTSSRSPSADSSANSAAKPGAGRQGSTASEDTSDMDEFLRDRLNPVVLRGGRNAFGNQTSIWAGKDEDSSSSPSVETLPKPQLLPSAMITGFDASPVRDASASAHKAPLSHNSENGLSSQFHVEGSSRQVHPPRGSSLNQDDVYGQSPSYDSYDSESSRHVRDNDGKPKESQEGKEGLWLRPLRKEQPPPKLKHKFNFLQRAQSSHLNADLRASNGDVPVDTIKSCHDALHLGIFNAIEPVDLAEVERIVREHDTLSTGSLHSGQRHSRVLSFGSGRSNQWSSPATAPTRVSDRSEVRDLSPSVLASQILTESPELLHARVAIPQQTRQSVQMVAAPRSSMQPINHSKQSPEISPFVATPELVFDRNDTPETPQSTDIARQHRLSPVGRIPMVVSKRDRDRRLPDNSFSRPFASTQPRPTVRPPGSLYNQIRDLASPTDSSSQPVSSTSSRSDSVSAANQSSINPDQPSASTNRSSFEFYAGNEFIVFAPRKNSDYTYSSSSSGSNWRSLMPAHASEDDIWNEYNDLMDDVMPNKTPISAGSSLGAPFQYANLLQDNRSPTIPAPLNVERSVSQATRSASTAPSGPLDQDSLLAPASLSTHASPRLQQENAAVAFAALRQDDRFTSRPVSPLTPDTLARFVGTYGDHSATSSVVQNRLSLPQGRTDLLTPRGSLSSRYSRNSRHSRTNSLPEANVRNSQISLGGATNRLARDTHLLDIPEHNTDKKSTPSSDLRFGALMTSKWLSFGRILFSPAHNEVRLADEARILVVDGLGDDWSHYVATSYPNAVVYNLSITPATASESSGWEPLTNYRHFNHPSLSAPFPFPRGFFTAVVFRFPVAATEQKYQACILESKRVLRPGGHLEVVALDIDMINMGTRGRRALRGLKTRMQQTDQDVSLGNLSDTLVRMIGRRGFEEVQRCVVGVPAAGRIPRSDDVLRSSSCSSTSTSGRPRTANSSGTDQQESDINFATLLQKNRQSQIVEPGRANDEGITKMVARVGRWWYSACYEQPLLENDKSVWQEHGLLRECEKQGTSFRLLICCAQKPLQPRRRTKSV
jgi:hypothetical protein